MTNSDFAPYDSADFLETEEEISGYLKAVFEGPTSPNLIAHALGVAVRARNLTALAKQIGMSRQGLIKALSGEGNPSFDTLAKVAGALGYHFVLEPSPAAAEQGAEPRVRQSERDKADKDKILAPAA